MLEGGGIEKKFLLFRCKTCKPKYDRARYYEFSKKFDGLEVNLKKIIEAKFREIKELRRHYENNKYSKVRGSNYLIEGKAILS